MAKYDSLFMASGGLDSTVMAYWLKQQGKRVLPLFIDYGQHFKQEEYKTLLKVIPQDYKDSIRVIRIGDVYQSSNSRMIKEPNLWEDDFTADDLYLPYRNLLFLSVAASVAQSENISDVYSAFINSNHAKEIDCSKDFFDRLGTMLKDYGTIKINMPFRDYSKTEVAELGIKLGVPIATTFSCQANSKVHCGVCPNCVDRLAVLNSL
ncbi:7-cyano-7-deazaguanine synthase [Cohnella hashimotonis]|uniref:7-cyano-7-deazaguanine synthase n=1 Tax=Cohnella hashimotonis TaxID=2826895 RepID=A0ABT6TS35_9BACL|nr:7-cyano-7-deazaguanine synthase [Cohnella hashimotonis]MDI4649595.1 7-cyano-7-deazaguanine synthase [Cohnella hashimotonis]